MEAIDESTSLQELAVLVSEALERAGIRATLSGGGAVSLYADNEYESRDLDFITSERNSRIAQALEPLGFRFEVGKKDFTHPRTEFFVEFPPGPLAFGDAVISPQDATVLSTKYGSVRIITATQSIMDRLIWYILEGDNQTFDQAVMVARRQNVDWDALEQWARSEGAPTDLIERLRRLAASY